MIKFNVTKEGAVLINVKGFSGYQLNCKNWEIISTRTGEALKPVKNAGVKSYELYRNGVKETVTLFTIMKNHWGDIETRYLSV